MQTTASGLFSRSLQLGMCGADQLPESLPLISVCQLHDWPPSSCTSEESRLLIVRTYSSLTRCLSHDICMARIMLCHTTLWSEGLPSLQEAYEDAEAAVRAEPNSAYALRRLGVAKLELAIADLKVVVRFIALP